MTLLAGLPSRGHSLAVLRGRLPAEAPARRELIPSLLDMDQVFHARFSDEATQTSGDPRVSLGNRASGVFAEWNWDGQQLTLTNDRYGFFPIYYFRRENEVAVSPSIRKLLELAGDVEFDDNAFSVFLRFGYLIAEDTLFKSIRAVPAGSTLTWHRGHLKIESTGIINKKPLTIARS